MADVYNILEDAKAWTRYTGNDEGDICVYRRCPECGKYVTEGKVTNAGPTTGWKCKTHGKIEPFYLRD